MALIEPRFIAYASHPAGSITQVRDYQLQLLARRPDLKLINPFFDVYRADEDRPRVLARVRGERVEFSHDYAAKVVTTNVKAILSAEGHITFNTQNDTIGSDMEGVYALLFGRKPLVHIFTNETNVYQIHPWLAYHSDKVFTSLKSFEEGIHEIVNAARAGNALVADRTRAWMRELLETEKKRIGERFTFYLAHATLNRLKVREWELEFENRHPDMELKNPFYDLDEGVLDTLVIKMMDNKELSGYPQDYDKALVHKDVHAIRDDCDGMIAVVKDYTIGGDMELVYANLLRKNPIIAVCSSQMIDHPWVKFHTDYQFHTLEDCEAALPAIIARVRAGEENERLESFHVWIDALRRVIDKAQI